MKKQSILDILCKEVLERNELEEKNFNSCIPNFQECIEEYIIPFLAVNQGLYNLDFEFDVNASDELIKKKSLILVELLSRGFKDIISTNPSIFHYYYDDDKDFEYACSRICFLVMLGNVIDFKKTLSSITI